MRLVDLSLDIYDGAPVFDKVAPTTVKPNDAFRDLGCNMSDLALSTHMGTHLDAPFHFIQHGRTVENLDVRRGLGEALILNFSHKGARADITADDLTPFEHKIQPGARVIVRTDWDKQYPTPAYFTDMPGIAPSACQWLVDHGVQTLALDTPTIHPGHNVETHHITLGSEMLIIEGLAHLESIRSERVLLIALPLRIRGRDGSPARVIAVEPASDEEMRVLADLFSNAEYEFPK